MTPLEGSPANDDDDAHGTSGGADEGDQVEKLAERVYRMMTQDMRLDLARGTRRPRRNRE